MRQAVGRLADAVGWPISWNDAASSDDPLGEIAVRDDDGVLGCIVLDAPDDPRLVRNFCSAREVAGVFAEVLSRLACASRNLAVRSRDISTLVEVGQFVPRAADVQSGMSHLLRAAAQLSGLWSSACFFFDARAALLRLRATYRLPAKTVPHANRTADAKSPDGRAAEDGAIVLNRFHPKDGVWLPPGVATGVCVPVLADGVLLGSLWGYDRRQRDLGQKEISVLQSIAAQIASVLERSALLQESAKQQQLQTELRIAARHLPVSLLQHPPSEWGLDVAVRAATVSGVGGDFCEVVPLGNHRTLFAIGDAVGHSVPAAMLVSSARGALRALLAQTLADNVTPAELMNGINRGLHAITKSEQFVTLVVGVIDSRVGTLTYTNAGHPQPLLLRGDEWLSLQSHGMFLGVVPETNYASSELELAAGDVLICFTDGVTETINASREVFRRQGIQSTIAAAGESTAEEMAAAIWRRLESHAPGPLRDDRTLLVLKHRGACRPVLPG